MSLVGPGGVFMFTAPVHVALAGFAVWRTMQRARPPAEERTVFKEVPPTSPALYELDPRAVSEATSGPSAATPRTGS